MKLKYLFSALLSVMLLAACSDDDKIGNLDTIELDQTFLSIPMEGGQATVTIKTSLAWQFDAMFEKVTTVDGKKDTTYTQLPNNPEWLTASQLSGEGETKVTLTASATTGGRETELCIVAGGKKQFLVVRQGSLEPAEATCKEVIEGPEGKSYKVSGVVTAIANTHYGNFYMNDGTSETDVYVYGTNDKNGKKGNDPIDGEDGWGFEVGDVITVEGPKQLYGSTVELVDVTVVKIVKSLLKVVSEPVTVGKEGGEVKVKVAYKGNGAYVQIPEDAQSWISYVSTEYVAGEETIFEPNPADTAVFKFMVAENPDAGRKADLKFQSFKGKDESAIDYTITQAANVLPHGMNPEDPFTVAEAIAKCQEIGSTSDGEIYYAKGIISSISEVSTSYGNATFNISDDGTDNNTITVFRALSLNNEKFTAVDEIAVGDVVVVTGKLVNYTKGDEVTPEFSGNVYVYSRQSAADAKKPGTLESPFTVAEAIDYINKEGADEVYVEGTVSKIVYTFDVNHGTGTFWISADGQFHDDASLDFEAYSVYWLGNKSWAEGNGQVEVGDKVVLYGKLTKYGTTYETSSKKAYIYSLNGKTE